MRCLAYFGEEPFAFLVFPLVFFVCPCLLSSRDSGTRCPSAGTVERDAHSRQVLRARSCVQSRYSRGLNACGAGPSSLALRACGTSARPSAGAIATIILLLLW